MQKEIVKQAAVIGRWFDEIVYPDGRIVPGPHGEFEWGYNQIQNIFAILMASWAKGESGYDRINYLAIGSGEVSWDTTPPTQSYDQAALTTEFYRKAIPIGNIEYLDALDVVTLTPTKKIQVSLTLLAGEATGTLREFALFGGTADGTQDSGEIINWIVHPKIIKDALTVINRKVRLEFPVQ